MEFTLADPGEGIAEVDVLEVHVSARDNVEEGDDLFTVESDKAITEVPASFSGQVTEVMVSAGDTVEVGAVLLTYETDDGAQQVDDDSETADEAEATGGESGGEDAPNGGEEPDVSEDGRVTEGDESDVSEGETERREVEDRAEGEPDEGTEPDSESAAERGAGEQTRKPRGSGLVERHRPVPASPATRALADRLGVDLEELEGSGPDGRIEPEDVQAAAEDGEAEKEQAETRSEDEGLSDFERWGEVERREMHAVRRATAEAMSESWSRIPHVTHIDVADITDLEAARQRYIEDEDLPLTITVFLVKAAVAALRQHPEFNASLDDGSDELILKRYYNIGIAVDTEDGLVVPVIRDVDRKPMVELAAEIAETADRMRSGDRSLEDFEGGTFTITNPGGIGGTAFTPIINHPEVAILGAGRAQWELVVDGPDSEPATRLRLPLVLAFDHRVVDGADAARFMRTVIEALEDTATLMIES